MTKKIKLIKNNSVSKNTFVGSIDFFDLKRVSKLTSREDHEDYYQRKFDDKRIEKIVKYIKGRSAIEMNKKLNLKGQFWHRNYFDKLIRNEKHFNLVYEYIQNNPLKAHLKDAKRVFSAYE